MIDGYQFKTIFFPPKVVNFPMDLKRNSNYDYNAQAVQQSSRVVSNIITDVTLFAASLLLSIYFFFQIL